MSTSRRQSSTSPSLVETLFFDFNGVLVDDEEIHYRSFLAALAPLGVRFPRALYDARYLASDDLSAARAILKDFGVRGDAPALVALKRRAYIRMCGPSFRIDPSITALVRRLRRAGARLAIVSGAARVEIEAVLRRSRLRGCFEVLIAAEDVRRCKPSPEGYKRAIKMMRARPATSLAIEDSPGGIAAARAAGLRVLGIATSYTPRALRRAGARHVVRSLASVDATGLIRPDPAPRSRAARPARATASRR